MLYTLLCSTHEMHGLGLPGRDMPGVLTGHSLSSAACMDMVAIGLKRLIFIDLLTVFLTASN